MVKGSTATAPERILPQLSVSNDLLAQMIIAKSLDRQPFYHLERRWFSRHGVRIPRDNMARWSIMLGRALQPIYNLMCDQISEYDIASLDATWLQVLKENGCIAQTRSLVDLGFYQSILQISAPFLSPGDNTPWIQ